MKRVIKKVDRSNKVFYCYIGNRKVGFYLTNRLTKLFLNCLDKNVLVDFEVSEKKKTINNKVFHHVLYFNEIKDLKNNKTIYNHQELKKDMVLFLENKKHYLFLDLEMTIPIPYQKNFKPEIIQFGCVLMEKNGKVILEDGSYVLPVKQNPLSRRTIKFLSINEELFKKTAISYKEFYDKLKDIIDMYNPKIVVWGKNDYIALEHSYNIHAVKKITESSDFVDLLKLHKDYFNLNNDLGLFKAYQTYYDQKFLQIHDAKDDAKVTKEVFVAFLNYSINELKNKEEIE